VLFNRLIGYQAYFNASISFVEVVYCLPETAKDPQNLLEAFETIDDGSTEIEGGFGPWGVLR
jgi:hypothetical protein